MTSDGAVDIATSPAINGNGAEGDKTNSSAETNDVSEEKSDLDNKNE